MAIIEVIMSSTIRVGIVGSRYAAEFHFDAYQRVTGVDVKVVGVTSLTKEHREKFAKERGIQVFDSLDEMLPDVDVVDYCSL
jgi:predicted dehydrogenase